MMLHAGRHQQSGILKLLFGIWVLAPFIGCLIADSVSKRWTVATRLAVYVSMMVLTLGSLAVYGAVAFGYLNAKVGFMFLVVPFVSWLLIALVVGTTALMRSREPDPGRTR